MLAFDSPVFENGGEGFQKGFNRFEVDIIQESRPGAGLEIQKNIKTPPFKGFFDGFSQPRFKGEAMGGHLEIDVPKAMVDAFDFRNNIAVCICGLAPAKACHGLDAHAWFS